jgi:tetratricopeptide (TPR) repeat protein
MVVNQVNRIARRLTAAEGYLELGLPADAQAELQTIEDSAPFEGAYMWLMGESLRNQGLYDEAIAPLRHAARALPSETGQQAWEALKECLEKSGRSATAEDMAQTMEYLEQRNDTAPTQDSRMDLPSNVRIDIPHGGNLQIKFDLNDGLTIKLNPPGSKEV